MTQLKGVLLIGCLVGISCSIKANVLFFDDFNSENGGNGELNYAGLVNWNVTAGAVDLVGNNFWDLLPGNGLYIDTEGSPSFPASIMVTKQIFNFDPGVNYTLSFDLAGNQYGIGVYRSEAFGIGDGGSILNDMLTVTSEAPFQTFSYTFTVPAPMSSPLTFAAGETGYVGPLLDNIELSSDAPAPVPDNGDPLLLGLATVLTLGIASASRNSKTSAYRKNSAN